MTVELWNKKLLHNGITKAFKRGDILYRPTDTCKSIGRVTEGSIRVSRVLHSGKEITIKVLNSGDYYAELIAFSELNYPGWIIASEDCKVVEVPILKVLELLRDRDNLKFFLSNIAKKVTKLTNNIELLSFKTVKQKLCYLITSSEKDTYQIDSISDLSITLGCSREALSRAISELVISKTISFTNGVIKILNDVQLEEVFF